jgi:DNA primase
MALPDGLDPDDFIRREGVESFRTLASQAPGFVEFYVRMNADRAGTIEGRRGIAGELFDAIRGLDDPLRQDEYLKLVASELGLDPFRCREEFRRAGDEAQKRANLDQLPFAGAPVNMHDAEFVAILLEKNGWAEAVLAALSDFRVPESAVMEVLRALSQSSGGDIARGLETDAARRLYSAAAAAPITWGQQGEQLVRERVARFKREALLAEREQLDNAIRSAKRAKDDSQETELVLRKIVLNKQIEQLGAA